MGDWCEPRRDPGHWRGFALEHHPHRFRSPVAIGADSWLGRGADVALPADTFDIDAAFHRVVARRRTPDSNHRLGVNDQVYLSVQTSVPTYLYVVNEDEKGHAFLLFPLLGADMGTPLDARTAVRVPRDDNWQVDAAGGKEHFIVFASTERQPALEEGFKRLPSPRPGEPQPLPADTLEKFQASAGSRPRHRARRPAAIIGDFTTPLAGPEKVPRGRGGRGSSRWKIPEVGETRRD